MESGLTASYEMIVLTDELVGMADNFMKGIEVTEETLMLDELHQVGPGGHFLDTDQTLARYRDLWYLSLLDRRRRTEWAAAGGLTMGEKLTARVKEIIAGHRPKLLAPDIEAQIHAILATAG